MDAGSSEKKAVRVTILNQTFTVLAPGDPAEIQELAQTVDELAMKIQARSGAEPGRAALLVCLHLADRLRTLERELAELKERVDAKSRHFSVLLDQVVSTGE